MRILFAVAEAYPFAKVGGLGDVGGSLPKALGALGHEVNLIMPRHGGMDNWRVDLGPYNVPMGEGVEVGALKEGNLTPEVPVLMVDHPTYFGRPDVYDGRDEGRRYAFFCRAVLEACRHVHLAPDVIHCNDWHTALIPAYLRAHYREDPMLANARTLYTIHNLEGQGTFPRKLLGFLGLPDAWTTKDVLLHRGKVNFMKAGLTQADLLSTVSATYGREIQTRAYGEGLEAVVRGRAEDLRSVVNGLDGEAWDPRRDPFLPGAYDPLDDRGKATNKRALQRELGLRGEAPLAGFVGRLVPQKGVDLLLEAMPDLLRRNLQVVLLGSGTKRYEEALAAWAGRSPRLAVVLRYDEGLAHRIYAGADLFLMPSRFEPCGLGQLISMRYGTVPVVRRTGGLADTVFDAGSDPETGTGFVFQEPSVDAFLQAVDAALMAYGDRRTWRRLRGNAVARDSSWAGSARAYEDLYREVSSMPPAGGGPRPPAGRG